MSVFRGPPSASPPASALWSVLDPIVLSIMPQAQAEAQKLGMVEFRISRLVRTTSFAEPLKQHAGPGRI